MVKNKSAIAAISFIFLYLFGQEVQAQQVRKHIVYFKEKSGSSYSIDKPTEFLSERAVQRRIKYSIPVTAKDLPVNKTYLQALTSAGAQVIYPSKWLNGALIEVSDSLLESIRTLPFVANSERLAIRESGDADAEKFLAGTQSLISKDTLSYGSSELQINMLGADVMHQMGFRGEGMVIAVLDAGFYKVNELSAFKHLFDEGKILGTYDFVAHEESVYEDNTHGLGVLSCIAAYLPGQMVGTAYNSNFYLFRTEDASQEYRVEEFNWLVAAERADSLGADVVNSSLGYSSFDDPSFNYLLGDLNGRTSLITRASNMAAATGMLVVNSAGNSGDKADWSHKITFPADADSTLSVGAVDPMSKHARFSSRGPTADGRIKPDVVAMGALTAVVQPNGQIKRGFGTSYAAPLVAGLVTGLWQAHPELNNMQVIDLLRQSASQGSAPNDSLGYGIPNFIAAHEMATAMSEKKAPEISEPVLGLYPLQVKKEKVVLQVSNFKDGNLLVKVTNAKGKVVATEKIHNVQAENQLLFKARKLQKGIYHVYVEAGSKRYKPLKFEKL
jgi:serine protease AprX